MSVINSVKYLQSTNFRSLSLNEKIKIKSMGRPTPNLLINQDAKSHGGKSYKRKFNAGLYEQHHWLCGCNIANAFFYFPFLLECMDGDWAKRFRKYERQNQATC